MDQIKFETTVRFPRSGTPDHPLVINALETDLGYWSHHISSLEGRVVFKSISLKTSNSPIRVDVRKYACHRHELQFLHRSLSLRISPILKQATLLSRAHTMSPTLSL